MINSLGIRFVRGKWYNCHCANHFFQYKEDRVEGNGGVYTIREYCYGREVVKGVRYISNMGYLSRATLATPEELKKLGIIQEPFVNNSYSIF